jgi:threonine synthase
LKESHEVLLDPGRFGTTLVRRCGCYSNLPSSHTDSRSSI